MKSALRRRLAFAITAIATFLPQAYGQAAYPTKPITLIVPFAAGAATDRASRSIARELEKKLGQPLVVENIAGASATLGARKLVKSPADGYTIMMGTMNDLVIAPPVMKPGYSLQDFTPLAKTGVDLTVLVAHPSLPANTPDEFVKMARASDDSVQIGVPGTATMQTFGAVLLGEAGGFKVQTIPYKAGAPLVTDLLGGQVKAGTIALSSVLPLIRQGKLKAIGVLSAKRHTGAPEIPTVNEGQLLKGVYADLWIGLMAPANLPPDVLARLSNAIRDVVADPAYRAEELRAGFMIPEFTPPAAFGKFVADEQARLKSMIANVKLD